MDTEDKIVFETIVKYTTYSGQKVVYLDNLCAALAEAYQKANGIGWETKVLDPLNDVIRKIVNA